MSSAAPIFVPTVVGYINLVLSVVCLIIDVWAFISCLTQRSDAFAAIGTLPKGAWLAIIGGLTLITALFARSAVGLIGLIAVTAAAIFLLDVRPRIRDVADGHGPW